MNNPTIPIGPHTAKLLENIRKEGNQSQEFTREEKLALVADGAMAPEEVGLPSAEAAQFELLPAADKIPKFGNEIFLQAGVIPLELRAEWAYQETKIILAPADKTEWIKKWVTDNVNTYRIQGGMRCGTAAAQFERTYRDPILGLANILKLAGEMLESAYTGSKVPPASDNSAQLEDTSAQDVEDRKKDESPEST